MYTATYGIDCAINTSIVYHSSQDFLLSWKYGPKCRNAKACRHIPLLEGSQWLDPVTGAHAVVACSSCPSPSLYMLYLFHPLSSILPYLRVSVRGYPVYLPRVDRSCFSSRITPAVPTIFNQRSGERGSSSGNEDVDFARFHRLFDTCVLHRESEE